MNSVLENSYAWTGSLVEAFHKLTCDVVGVIFASLSLTPNASDSDSTSASSSETSVPVPSTTSSPPVVSSDKTSLNITQIFQDLAVLFAFDDFQYLLLKIFVTILLSNVCLIYIIWYIYGERITERFMSPNSSAEELKRAVLQLKLPSEHSQRYA